MRAQIRLSDGAERTRIGDLDGAILKVDVPRQCSRIVAVHRQVIEDLLILQFRERTR